MAPALALVFPGQGSQRIGMLEPFRGDDTVARLLDAAEGLSGLPLRRIAAQGTEGEVADTRAAQPLLFLADWAWGARLEAAGVVPAAVAGHSLGEFAALALARVFSVEAGLELVVTRSRIMAEVAASTPGGMAAVIGMDGATVAGLLEGASGVWVANDNCPGQVVVSGTHAGIEWATGALAAAGARKIVPLNVAGPFHSPLMASAAEAFAAVLQETAFSDARIPVLQNTTPVPTRDAGTIRERLLGQIVSPVRWTETMSALAEMGISTLVEAGPGAVLTGLARRMDGVTGLAAETEGVDRIREVAL
jgi:[acyl-carrier-protein] S-malonyltransferase